MNTCLREGDSSRLCRSVGVRVFNTHGLGANPGMPFNWLSLRRCLFLLANSSLDGSLFGLGPLLFWGLGISLFHHPSSFKLGFEEKVLWVIHTVPCFRSRRYWSTSRTRRQIPTPDILHGPLHGQESTSGIVERFVPVEASPQNHLGQQGTNRTHSVSTSQSHASTPASPRKTSSTKPRIRLSLPASHQ